MIEIDEIDRTLIDELVADGRASYTTLARNVSMSQAAVKARVTRLINNGTIHILGRIDPRALGYGEFLYCLVDVDGPVAPTAQRLAAMNETAFVLILAGSGGLFVELRARDTEHLTAAVETVRTDPQVRGLNAATLVSYYKQDWSQIGVGPTVQAHHVAASHHDVDAIDIKLLEHLAADGRATFTDMARTASMSQAATRERVLGLLAAGVVTVQTIVSPGVHGVKGYAGLLIGVDGPVRPVATTIAERPDVALVATVLGNYDIVVEAGYRDESHLAELLDEIRTVKHVRQLDAFVYLVEVKEEMTAGLR